MSRENIIILIDGFEFIMNNGSKVDIYNKGNKNFVRYNGDKFEISNNYSIPNLESSQVPISFEGGLASINVRVNQKLTKGVVYIDDKPLEGINTEKIRVSEDPSVVTLRNLGSGSGEVLKIFIKPVGDEVVDKDKHSVEDRFVNNEMYSENSEGIKTFKEEDETVDKSSKKKIYTDLDIIPDNLDLDYLKFIGCGSYRNVYDVLDKSTMGLDLPYDVVIKIATNKNGIISNKREVETWNSVRGTDLEKLFCPIVDRGPDFKYIVMKKVDRTLLDSGKSVETRREMAEEIKEEIKSRIDEDTIQTPTTQSLDITSSNAGEISEDIVLIDYPYGGNFQYINK